MTCRSFVFALLAAPAFAATTAVSAQNPATAPTPGAQTKSGTDGASHAPPALDEPQARRELDSMREQMRELSKKMAVMSARLGDVGPRTYAYRYIGDSERGMIGVALAQESSGVRISAVTPGGPADKAGLHDGDLILSVRGSGEHDVATDAAGITGMLRNLDVGQDITLSLQRGGKNLEVKVKAERREPFNLAYSIDGAEAEKVRAEVDQAMHGALALREQAAQIREQAQAAARDAAEQGRDAAEQSRAAAEQARHAAEQGRQAMQQIRYSTPWWGLNLTSLNADLGSYFGTDHGALVLSADAQTAKALKSGDVLIAINGKRIQRPEDAMRILRDADSGTSLKVEVLRQRKTQTLSMPAPQFKSLFVPVPPAPLAPLQPLSPPAPPAPPTVLKAPPPPPPRASLL